jgi:hypothetical protein
MKDHRNSPRARILRALLPCAILLATMASPLRAAETFSPDAEGYIRHWVMLAPIAFRPGDSGAEAILKEQVPGEARLNPKAGDKVSVGGKELTWTNVTAGTNHFDFNATLKTLNDQAAGYLATYVECDEEIPNVIMAVASNDQGRIYFNGVDIYAFTEARTLMLDSDKGRVTLRKGINTILFKVTNEQNSWQGALRLLDKSGAPLKGIRIRQSP